ncbi:MAG: hypothetical protein WC527_04335 [Candidatus Margulisiibacteriota bacterium]
MSAVVKINIRPILEMPVLLRHNPSHGVRSVVGSTLEISKRTELRPMFEIAGKDYIGEEPVKGLVRAGDYKKMLAKPGSGEAGMRVYGLRASLRSHDNYFLSTVMDGAKIEKVSADKDGYTEIDCQKLAQCLAKAKRDGREAIYAAVFDMNIPNDLRPFIGQFDLPGIVQLIIDVVKADVFGRGYLARIFDVIDDKNGVFNALDARSMIAVAGDASDASGDTGFYKTVVLPRLFGESAGV